MGRRGAVITRRDTPAQVVGEEFPGGANIGCALVRRFASLGSSPAEGRQDRLCVGLDAGGGISPRPAEGRGVGPIAGFTQRLASVCSPIRPG